MAWVVQEGNSQAFHYRKFGIKCHTAPQGNRFAGCQTRTAQASTWNELFVGTMGSTCSAQTQHCSLGLFQISSEMPVREFCSQVLISMG